MTPCLRAFVAGVAVTAAFAISPHPSAARDLSRASNQQMPRFVEWAPSSSDNAFPGRRQAASAAADTLVLGSWTFNGAGSCTAQGWTIHDVTINPAVITHVDDFAGLGGGTFGRLHAISGSRSMWCGSRPDPVDPNVCGYAALPGYGNSMDQTLTLKNCVYPVGDVVFDYYLTWDVEPSYDFIAIEIDHCDDAWTGFPPGGGGGCGYYGGGLCTGFTAWGVDSLVSLTIPAADHQGQFRVRIRASSDGAWSDQDGMWNTDGAYITDDLLITDQNGVVVPLEDFESAPLGATEVANWVAGTPAGYGTHAAIMPGGATLQRGTCTKNLSCIWAFFAGSTYNYSCGGYPAQPVVPFGNAAGQYMNNEIRSPWVPNAGAGSEYFFDFDVYRDLPLDNLVFFVWHIRSRTAGGCPTTWQDFNFVYYGSQVEWERQRFPVGSLVEPGATELQVAFGVWDLCGVWCGIYGSGACHSNGPLFDNPRLLRVGVSGPRWTIRDIDQFQDSFAADGTLTGTVRADMAMDILSSSNLNILPGDSAVVAVLDPDASSLATDPTAGGAAVYCYVSVWPQGQPGKSGAGLQAPEIRNGNVRYPVVGNWTDISGTQWTIVRADTAGIGGGYYTPLDRYCVDLRDDLFTPGDTICFFWAAKNSVGLETYAFSSNLGLASNNREEAAANPAEFTCLPAGGYNRGGQILYVDGMDGRGAQPYWDTAFASLGILDKVDRYDVRGPSSDVANRPASRVVDFSTQLLGCYRSILWDCGNLSITLGNPYGWDDKSDDYALVSAFLNGLANPGGLLLMGDDVGQSWSTGTSGVTLRSYIPFNLTTGNHVPLYGLSPTLVPVNGGCYDDGFVVQGGCPTILDFDAFTPTGSATLEMTYGPANVTNGAVIANSTDNGSSFANVVLAGFGFSNIRDNDLNGVSDRAQFLASTLAWLGTGTNQPTGTGTVAVNGLDQNYPNPFNPQTTIAFSVKDRVRVRLAVFSVAGERVRTLADEELPAGAHTRVWDGRNDAGQAVASGIYFYRLTAGDFVQTKKMVLLK